MKVKVKVYSVAHVWPSGTNNFDILDVSREIFKFDIEGAEEDGAERIILGVCHQVHNFVI